MSTKRALLIAALAVTNLMGDEAFSWQAVTSIAPGTQVELIHGNLKRTKGALIDANPDRIEVDTPAGIASVPRTEVRRVSIFRKSRVKRTLAGAAFGAGIGAAGFAIAANVGDIDIRRELVVGAGAAVGAVAGAIAGAALSGPETVYRRP